MTTIDELFIEQERERYLAAVLRDDVKQADARFARFDGGFEIRFTADIPGGYDNTHVFQTPKEHSDKYIRLVTNVNIRSVRSAIRSMRP
ncbi:hypothetical protein NKL07_21940 [Mesorhizobium sp. C280B]|uniref:hypothetical protein n=1 Tax=unclassified Mesorhizobium TaxID=325217 RepID=UPI0004145BDB|nr:hypothetical protein [Mesorhizobium sp. LSJC280B00]